ncbi:hypothetical protein AD929_04320 [Gluconobacter potus]|uniref:Type 4 secretion system PilS N-terminal domain-containing protein n=2 Tax=Gluconobacter potus TaxID=2724927 RepID=A0A149QXK5_9PROT|nr:hypothetical protein AD929_04320 [Gluconobacter potus]
MNRRSIIITHHLLHKGVFMRNHVPHNAYATRRFRRGIGLLETLLALFIGGLIIAGIMLLFANANSGQNVNDTLTELGDVQGAVHSAYNGSNNYSTLTTQVLAQSGLLPKKWSSDNSTIINPFHGTLTLAPATINGGTDNAFSVTMASVPDSACSQLLTMDYGSGLLDHTVDGTDLGTSPGTPDQLQMCTSGNSNNHTFVWTYN